MTIATGVGKKIAFKKEASWGVPPGATGAAGEVQYLRRTSSSLDISKDSYQSKQIRTDYQVSDMRHGVRKVSGDIKDELSVGTFEKFIAAALRAGFTAGVSVTGTTIGATSVGNKFTKTGGNWVTSGFKKGDIIQVTGMTGATANCATNWRVADLTGASYSEMAVVSVNGSQNVVTEAAGNTVTLAVNGKKCMVPQTGHTNDSFTIEHQYTDINVYEQFNGCKVSSIDINMPSTGMAEITISFMGKDMTTVGTAYFTAPTAATTTGILAAVNGALVYDGTASGIVTGMQLKIDGGYSTGTAVGSSTTPDVFPGRVTVTGSFSAYFADSTIQTAFLTEGTPSLQVLMTDANNNNAEFLNIVLPKIKLSGATRTDSEQGLTLQAPFTALLNTAGSPTGATSELTTITIQDSSL